MLILGGDANEDWVDEACFAAVAKILESLDDIHVLQDPFADVEVMHSILQDKKLHELLEVL